MSSAGDMGKELQQNNETIVKNILLLKEQRCELAFIIEKQFEERKKLETEMERITYKLCLINKSLGQRLKARNDYDSTLAQIEEKYAQLVKTSEELVQLVKKEFNSLDSMINKTTNTDIQPSDGSGEALTTCKLCSCATQVNQTTSKQQQPSRDPPRSSLELYRIKRASAGKHQFEVTTDQKMTPVTMHKPEEPIKLRSNEEVSNETIVNVTSVHHVKQETAFDVSSNRTSEATETVGVVLPGDVMAHEDEDTNESIATRSIAASVMTENVSAAESVFSNSSRTPVISQAIKEYRQNERREADKKL